MDSNSTQKIARQTAALRSAYERLFNEHKEKEERIRQAAQRNCSQENWRAEAVIARKLFAHEDCA